MKSRIMRTPPSDRSGAVVVETAIVMPIFLMIVFGMVEFGRAMSVGQLATNGARYGARTAILDGSTNQQVVNDVKNLLVNTVHGITANDVAVTITVIPAANNSNPSNQLSVARPRDICRVNVTIPYHKVAYFSPRFLAKANLRGSCSMAHE
ncbi:TadE/TadG family type IV pilus assembly protein [Planctomicrobium sp. SH668]|uniref:TadE/TadG family type IV pilus assembly protein n=1 Tax=Planctomicrobium sp. SH668 TaxID=3448126 RepID=UPI003F5B3AE5